MRVCLLRGWSGEWQEEGRRLASGQPPRFASGDCCCRYPHPWNCITNSTSEPDLSELTPISPRAGQYLVLDWSALPQNEPRVSKTGTAISAGAEVQALGYMMDGDRSIGKNQWVQ